MHISATDTQLAVVLDGGGTKTKCNVLRIEDRLPEVVAMAVGDGSNPAAIGVDRAVEVVATVVRNAVAGADGAGLTVDRAVFALAGTLGNQLRQAMEQRLADLALSRISRVFPDIWPIVIAGSPRGVGAAIVAGTGSATAALDDTNRLAVTGGWGYLLGDEGSGFALGRDAIRHTLQQLEFGRELTPLVQAVLSNLHATSIADVKAAIYGRENPRQGMAALAPLVVQMADDGIAIANTLVAEAAASLSDQLQRSVSRLNLSGKSLSIAVSGGLLQPGGPLLASLEKCVRSRFGDASITCVRDPLQACQRLLSDEYFFGEVEIVT